MLLRNVRYRHSVCCDAMRGTEIGYAGTSLDQQGWARQHGWLGPTGCFRYHHTLCQYRTLHTTICSLRTAHRIAAYAIPVPHIA
eukprot:734952-Rhodomonas_salina.3